MIARKDRLIIWWIGLMSGFALMITGSSLNYWLAKEAVEVKTIGIFSLISLPYAINFIWAPIFDVFEIPVLSKVVNKRVSWVILIQLLLSSVVYFLGHLSPLENLWSLGILGVMVSFLASAQDTVLGAFRAEIVASEKQGQVSGVYVFGYRIGTLLSSSGAIYLSSYLQWNLIFEFFSLVILTFPIILLLLTDHKKLTFASQINEFHNVRKEKNSNKFKSFIQNIITPIGSGKYLAIILAFLVLYRLPDNFIAAMINPFLIHLEYDELEIATAGKFFGVSSAVVGGIIASKIMKHYSITHCLLIFGVLHGLGHLLFVLQEISGKNLGLFFFVTGFESVTGGMAMAAYIGYITSLCKGRFKATQYSFLSSMMGLSRSIFPSLSGYIVSIWGWKVFYIFTAFATIPSLVIILFIRKTQRN